MGKINYQNLPNTTTPLNATNLNAMQNIVETGTNANGTYIKYDDGTLICYRTSVFNTLINNAWGSMYESPQQTIGDFAYTFYTTPTSVFGICSGSRTAFVENISNTSATSFGKTYIARPNSQNTAYDYTFSFTAIGRWKA